MHAKRIDTATLVLSPGFNRGTKKYLNLYSYLVKFVKTSKTSSLPNIMPAIKKKKKRLKSVEEVREFKNA